jgi:FMN phosphatase YigB (HAD superfamily)
MNRAAIFDLDDTLYAREQFVQSGFAAVAHDVERRHGVPAASALATLRHAHANGRCGAELQVLCADYGLPPQIVPRLVQVIRGHEPVLELAPGAQTALARLRAEGWGSRS